MVDCEMPASPNLVTDLALARRLERAEATANAAFVESRARQSGALGACWHDFDGTYAMFDGVGSPLTQTFGLGLFATPDEAQLRALEQFFRDRSSAVFHEVSPLADASLLSLLPARGYVPIELTSVMRRPLDPQSLPDLPAGAVTVRITSSDELAEWADVSARGWGESPELAEFMRTFGSLLSSSRGVTCHAAEIDGCMVGTGALAISDGVALLAGASTVPAYRGRGVQTALLAARLRYAMESGCDLAMMGASPGSTSQTNAERQGFRIAYTRIKWHLPLP